MPIAPSVASSTGTAGDESTHPTRLMVGRLAAWLAVATVTFACAAAALATATPWDDVVKQGAYVVLAVVLPGTIVHRVVRGPMSSWLADLALGSATGLAVELVAWALFSLAHAQSVLWCWPLLTLILVVLPGTRQRLIATPVTRERWGAAPVAAIALACVTMVMLMFQSTMSRYELPPSGRPIYTDLVWHMGLVNEAARSIPLLTPQSVADGLLRYHWFSDAHIATTHLITGTDVATLVLRLWFLPVGVLTVALTAVLAQRVSGRAWVGALAGWLVLPTLGYPFWPGIVNASNHMSPLSPSQLFSLPLTLLLVTTLVDLFRRERGVDRGAATLAVLAALACSGSKSSALPVVTGGIGIAFVAAVVLRRNWRIVLVCGVAASAIVIVALRFVAGGDAGSGVQLLSALSLSRAYRTLVTATPDFSRPWLDGLVNTPGVGPVLLVALSLATALTFVRLGAALLPFVQRSLRGDLAAWLLGGTCLASVIPFLVIAHPGYSEFYFLFGAIPFGAVLWAWSIGALVGDDPSRARVACAALGLSGVATLAIGLLPHPAPGTSPGAMSASLRTFVLQVTLLAGVLVLLAVVALRPRRRGRDALMPLAACLVIGPLLASGPLQLLRHEAPAPPRSNPHLVDQGEAAAWIRDHVPVTDVMATNDHCLSGSGMSCNAREWWISGLGGRRVLLEGWQYLPGAGGKGHYNRPELYAMNQAAFTRPGPETLAAVRSSGVSWLVADSFGSLTVSADLARRARLVFSVGTIAIYRLP